MTHAVTPHWEHTLNSARVPHFGQDPPSRSSVAISDHHLIEHVDLALDFFEFLIYHFVGHIVEM